CSRADKTFSSVASVAAGAPPRRAVALCVGWSPAIAKKQPARLPLQISVADNQRRGDSSRSSRIRDGSIGPSPSWSSNKKFRLDRDRRKSFVRIGEATGDELNS